MSGMFQYASEFEGEKSLAEWNVSKVRDFSFMFQESSSLDVPGIGSWDVSSYRSLQSMFDGAAIFNQPIENWDIRRVTSLKHMFRVSPIEAECKRRLISVLGSERLTNASDVPSLADAEHACLQSGSVALGYPSGYRF
jgi:Mycoplasma protein of unknown function, DUF285